MSLLRALSLSLILIIAILALPAAAAECPTLQTDFQRAIAEGNAKASLAAGDLLFRSCVIADRDWQGLSVSYAAALTRGGRTEDALEVLKRCISRQSDAAQCALEKANLLARLGRVAEAQKAMEAAHALGVGAAPIGRPPPHQDDPAALPQGGKAGTGFFVTQTGIIVTNAHVIAGCNRITTRSGPTLRLILSDPRMDLALLQASQPASATAIFRSAPAPRIGEDVVAFGYPLPGLLSSEGNVTTGILSANLGLSDNPTQLQITAPVQSGNSGGPLVDAGGNVIGVVVAKLDAGRVAARTGDLPQNVNFAIKAEEVTRMLDSQHIPFQQSPLADRRPVADLADSVSKFTVQILCQP